MLIGGRIAGHEQQNEFVLQWCLAAAIAILSES
jgi:hypothetical protein